MGARLVIVGIDGGTFDLAGAWAEQGLLPNLARLMEKGVWGDLTSTYPPITAPAWSSFLTGCNPGKHGVFDFLVRDPSSENVVDAQFGYTFQSGMLEGMTVLMQANNITDEEFTTINGNDDRQVIDYQRYGRTYSVGINYKF